MLAICKRSVLYVPAFQENESFLLNHTHSKTEKLTVVMLIVLPCIADFTTGYEMQMNVLLIRKF